MGDPRGALLRLDSCARGQQQHRAGLPQQGDKEVPEEDWQGDWSGASISCRTNCTMQLQVAAVLSDTARLDSLLARLVQQQLGRGSLASTA